MIRIYNIPRYINFNLKNFKRFNRETFPLMVFVGFSTYILYKMEKT
jgi:hypothetical protein